MKRSCDLLLVKTKLDLARDMSIIFIFLPIRLLLPLQHTKATTTIV